MSELLLISRRRKRRWAVIKGGLWGLCVFFGLALLLSIFYLPPLRINQVAFFGSSPTDEAILKSKILEILSNKYFFIFPKDNIVFYAEKEIAAFLRSNYRIEEFEIKRSFPAALLISLKERSTWAVWCQRASESEPSDCIFVDEKGFAYAKSPDFSGSLILKIYDARSDMLGKYVFPEGVFDKIKYLIASLKKEAWEEIIEIEISEGDVYRLVTKNNWAIIIDSEIDEKKTSENIMIALNSRIKDRRKDLEYIDGRFSDKVFFRFR